MRLTDEELSSLLCDIESDRVERKENLKGDVPEKIRQAICAFANDLPGHRQPGVVFVGVRDQGGSAEIAITEQLLLSLAAIRSEGHILPLPSMMVEKRLVQGMELAVVTVMPADAPPVRYKGRIYIRTGPRRDIASAQDERILNERRRHRDLPFDLQLVSFARLADIDRVTFEHEYLPHAFSRDVIAANHRSYEERLSACRMIESADNPVPTVLGSFVLGTRPRDLLPGAYVQFLRVDGVELSSPITDESDIDGRLGEILRKIDDKLKAHISTAIDIRSQETEVRRADYPLAALQQLIRNAVMHRSYENTHAPIRLTWFHDRIEIINPGGPYGMVTVENFGQPGITDYRNPNIAEAMKVLGFVQRFGVGIATAQRALQENGNPPLEFQLEQNYVLIKVRRAV